MMRRNYFLMAALPSLADLGVSPPLTGGDLIDMAGKDEALVEILSAIFLGDDLVQRDALLAGETAETEPAVLTRAQVANEEPLPAFLAPEETASDAEAPPRRLVDDTWSAYFRYVLDVAQRRASQFLKAMVGNEVALRNALAAARAKALGLDPADYVVAAELADADVDPEVLVAEWSAAPDAMAAQRILDHARWQWLVNHDRWFEFSDDEVAAYAAKLMLLIRWHRTAAPAEQPADAPGDRKP